MSAWSFDEARFVEEVLGPVQDGWPAGDDLFRTYLLPPDSSDQRVIARALDEVGRQFGKQHYRAFRRACDLLRSQHPAAAEVLTDPARRALHRAQVRARSSALAARLRRRLDGAPGLSPGELADLIKSSRGTVTASAALAALAELGAAVREPAELPHTPRPSQWAQARSLLVQLQHGSLWSYLSSAAELAGAGTGQRQLDHRRERLRVSRSADSAAETTVLKLIEQWRAAAGLLAALRYEIIEQLMGEADLGYPAVERAATECAERLTTVGLPGEPADAAYAVWCASRASGAQQTPAWTEVYQAALQAGQLRAAHTVLSGQPSLPAEWQRTASELATRLAALDEELDRYRALQRTDPEAAVEAYLRLRAQLSDPLIDSAIERCRPAPARQASATVDGGRVVITWQPSSSTAGHIRYRVSRGDTVVAEAVAECTATDPRPPGAKALVYSVRCERDGNPAAEVARTGPVIALPEVDNLELLGGRDSLSGQWRLPAGATGAAITRHTDTEQSALPGRYATSFVDRDVRPGVHYRYHVRARYRLDDGSTALSDGRWAAASCQELPTAVTDLHVELDGDEISASWTPGGLGEVELLMLPPGADIPEPGVRSVQAARRHGTALPATATATARIPGQLRAAAPAQRLVILPVTVLGELAAVGAARELDGRLGRVGRLRALRLGSTVQLTWEWPPGSSEVRVVWRTAKRPVGPTDPEASVLDITRVRYDSRGFTATVGAGEHWFGVCTMVSGGTAARFGQARFGPMVTVRESTPREAFYRVRREHLPRRRWQLLVEDPANGQLPPVVLLAKSGVRSMNRDDGKPVLQLPGGRSPLRGDFALPSELGRPVHLRAFSLDPELVLVPARPAELIVR